MVEVQVVGAAVVAAYRTLGSSSREQLAAHPMVSASDCLTDASLAPPPRALLTLEGKLHLAVALADPPLHGLAPRWGWGSPRAGDNRDGCFWSSAATPLDADLRKRGIGACNEQKVPPERLELSTSRVKTDCSIQLSYGGEGIVDATSCAQWTAEGLHEG